MTTTPSRFLVHTVGQADLTAQPGEDITAEVLDGWTASAPTAVDFSRIAVVQKAVLDVEPTVLVLLATTGSATAGPVNRLPRGTRPWADYLTHVLRVAFPWDLVITTVEVAGIDIAATADAVTAALSPAPTEGGTSPVATVTWGTGSSDLALAAMSGTLRAGFRLQVRSLFAPHRTFLHIDPRPVPPVVPWMIRLGYPQALLDLPGAGPSGLSGPLRTRVAAIAAQLELPHTTSGRRSSDFHELIRTDLRRGDATSGLAVRAAAEARCHELGEQAAEPDLIDEIQTFAAAEGQVRTLGDIIAASTSPEYRRRAPAQTRFLNGCGVLNSAGRASTHDWTPLDAAQRDAISRILRLPLDTPVPELPDAGPFGPPTGRIAYLWAPGVQQIQRPTLARLVLSELPESVLYDLTGVDDRVPFRPHLLLLRTPARLPGAEDASDGNADEVERTVAEAYSSTPGSDGTRGRSWGPAATAIVDVVSDRPTDAQAQRITADLRSWLQRVGPDAVVVPVAGSKGLLLCCLEAALGFASGRGVPMLVRSFATGTTQTLHTIGIFGGVDKTLLSVAAEAFRRLDLRTCQRLLTAASGGAAGDLVAQMGAFRQGFDDLGDHTGTASRLRICLRRIEEPAIEADSVATARLLCIAAECVRRPLAALPRAVVPASWWRLLRTRDALSIVHGTSVTPTPARSASLIRDALRVTPADMADPRLDTADTDLAAAIGHRLTRAAARNR